MAFGRKKQKIEDEELDFSVIDDYKEPFTWANFWDEQILGRYQAMRKFLDERGILFFLTSPFQYRNRLITKLVIIVLGVLLGVVPRMQSLITQTKERNAQSEFSQIFDKNFSSGIISVSPLMSSQYEKQHLLAFKIDGATANGVPSTTEDYKVDIVVNRGVMDANNVKYSYTIVPVNESTRLLLIHVDNTDQNDETGIYDVKVGLKDSDETPTSMEVVLSNTQETTALYDESGIHLAALSGKLNRNATTEVIKLAEEKLEDSLNTYEINYNRLTRLKGTDGKNYEVGVTRAALEEFITAYTVLPTLTDASTSDDVAKMEEPMPVVIPKIISTLTADGQTINDDTTKTVDATQQQGVQTDNTVKSELSTLTKYTTEISNALANLNSTRQTRYDELMTLARTLNQEFSIEEFTDGGVVKETQSQE